MAPLVLYFLAASRSIRIAWLLEELGLDYRLEIAPRENNRAPADFKAKCGSFLGKFPVLRDGDLLVVESGAITDYLLETYDTEGKLLLKDKHARVKVREWMHAAEGTFMIHGLAITYARWNIPEPAKSDGTTLSEMERGMSVNVQKDLDWLEHELGNGKGKYLVGDSVTAADTMMAFSIHFIFKRDLGTQGKRWEKIEAWLKGLEAREPYKTAVQKSGYSL